MISKAKAVKGSAQAFDYLLNDKGQAVELDRNLITGERGQELLAEFREVQAQNTKVQSLRRTCQNTAEAASS